MAKKFLKCIWGIIKAVLLVLYVFLFYEMLVIPAVLDWSVYGVLLTAGLVTLLILCMPSDKRKSTTVLAITFLLALQALENISGYPIFQKSENALFIFVLLLIVGKLLGRYKVRQYFVVFLVALILTSALDLSQAPLWTEFMVKWESPQLYQRYATVDYFPVRLADVDNDGTKEIITQENLEQAKKEEKEFTQKGNRYQILEPEQNHYAVYKWNGKSFTELSPDKYDKNKLLENLPQDYIGFPIYESKLGLSASEGIRQEMNPLVDRAELVEKGTNIGALPFTMLQLNQQSLASRLKSQNSMSMPSSTRVVARGKMLPGSTEQVVTLDTKLKVWDTAPGKKLVAELGKDKVSDIGTSEVILGDVDNDKIDELLLTSETSRILKLTPDGTWQILWVSPEQLDEKARFQKFRFEDFASLGKKTEPQIIALSKSNARNNPTRYMTGYKYSNGSLVQTWRVFSGLINLRAGDIDGDGQNELVAYMYRAQRLFVLKKHDFPVVPLLYGITGGLILLGFALQLKKKNNLNGGGQNV